MSLNIELKYSEKGIPYIDLDKYGTLIFSQLTATEKGYKWMAYNHSYRETVKLKNTAGQRYEKEAFNRISHVFNMFFKRDMGNLWGVPRGTIPPKIVKELRKIFLSLIEDDFYMPFRNLELLKDILEGTDFESLIKVKKKAPKKKKKARRKYVKKSRNKG
jgi:hypothetical protein